MTKLRLAFTIPWVVHLINGVALLATLACIAAVYTTIRPNMDDFKQYWQAAVNIRETGDPYATTPDMRDPAIQQARENNQFLWVAYPNPPLLAYLVQPLAQFPHPLAQRLWFGVNCVALAGLIALSIYASGSQLARRFWGVVAFGACAFPPTMMALFLGQIAILLSLLVVASLVLAQRFRGLAGVLLALASFIKLYPGLIGVYYLVFRPRRAAWWSIASVAGIAGLTLLWHGITPYLTYVTKVVLGNYYPYEAEFNISLVGFIRRLLTDNLYAIAIADVPQLATALIVIGSLAIVALCFWCSSANATPLSRILQWNAWLCAMLLLSPVNGYYNLVLLVPAVLAMVRYIEVTAAAPVRIALMLATLLCLMTPGWYTPLGDSSINLLIGWGQLGLSLSFYGLVAYFGLLVYLARKSRLLHET
ncbi:MAG: DUF2029 domain-containing protein [Chloroflexaceae bacterium]|nr:DUF2029 domain-containing protein [Chloroflexaceae bacterium]